jgi:1,4-dihydroxy-2-naphthoate polyprenyltransferase
MWLEVRVIPVLLWSFSALTLGTAVAARGQELRVGYYLGAVALGVLIQGILAHTVNEIVDWRSGTDADPSPRVISGGSKVIRNGLLGARGLWTLFAVALALTVALGLALVIRRGWVMLPFGLAGVAGALSYSLPPVRGAYRPFVGEAIAFGCLVTCVTGAIVLQGGRVGGLGTATAVAVAAYAVSMLMVHHDLDRDADLAARPPKVTTIVRLGRARGHVYAIGWCATAIVAALAAAAQEPRLLPLAIAYTAGLAAHLRCRPGDVESVTRAELAIILCGVAGALVASALLVPGLAVTAAVAAAVVALEFRVAVPPAGSPAA